MLVLGTIRTLLDKGYSVLLGLAIAMLLPLVGFVLTILLTRFIPIEMTGVFLGLYPASGLLLAILMPRNSRTAAQQTR